MDWHPVISVQQQTPDNDFLSFQHFKSTFCILGIFVENRKNSGLAPGQNDDPVTRLPGRERRPKWPIDPVTQWPSSMSGIHSTRTELNTRPRHAPPGRNTFCALQCVVVCLFVRQSASRNRNTISQDSYNSKRIKQPCGLNGQHRAVPLTCRQNSTLRI